MTTITIDCECGWSRAGNTGARNDFDVALRAAFAHAEKTNHTLSIKGTIRKINYDDPAEETLEIGKRYSVKFVQGGTSRERSTVMDYIGRSDTEYFFSARPKAGTQPLPIRWITEIEEVPKTTPIRV
jgi:hypothetical protein